MNDRLLEVISTRGKMSIEDFNAAFDRIVPENEDLSFARRGTLSALDALGHCETDWSRRQLSACRPVLARLPKAGCPRVVLTGARVAQTVFDLENYAKAHPDAADFSRIPQAKGLPDVITLEAADEETLNQCAAFCHLPLSGQLPAAWTLANVSGHIDDYKARLTWKPDAPLNWRQRIFDPRVPSFLRADDPRSAEILAHTPHLTEHTDPITQQRHCRWTKDGFYSVVAHDWGRWFALAITNERVLLYDERRQRLAAPVFVPLPRLLARALTLCSGRAAFLQRDLCFLGNSGNHQNGNIYDSVPPKFAELIARKCGQSCKTANLEREADRA
jgi:hypothetical protein